jgi:hypothetical protein
MNDEEKKEGKKNTTRALAVAGGQLDVERELALAPECLDVQLVLDVLEVVLLALAAPPQRVLKRATSPYNVAVIGKKSSAHMRSNWGRGAPTEFRRA